MKSKEEPSEELLVLITLRNREKKEKREIRWKIRFCHELRLPPNHFRCNEECFPDSQGEKKERKNRFNHAELQLSFLSLSLSLSLWLAFGSVAVSQSDKG